MQSDALTIPAQVDDQTLIHEDTVNSIARLLDGQVLNNGEVLTACGYDDDDCLEAGVEDFNPSFLPIQVQDRVRDRLSRDGGHKLAVRIFNNAIRHDQRLSVRYAADCKPHLKVVN